MDLIYVVLYDKVSFLTMHISTPFLKHLLRIIHQFEKLTSLPNICGAIDGTHIPLVEMPSKIYTFINVRLL
jgi:hypothetical protein